MLQSFEAGKYSLRHFLKSVNTQKIIPESLESLISVDTVGQFREALLKLKENTKS